MNWRIGPWREVFLLKQRIAGLEQAYQRMKNNELIYRNMWLSTYRSLQAQQKMLSDGESTEKWAIHSPGFLGSRRQLLDCARCGETLRGSRNEPMYVRDILTPTKHFLCTDCYNALPD